MKKILVVAITLIASVSSFAQNTKSHVSMNLYGGTKNTVGFQITGGKDVIFGLGVGMFFGESYVGEDFTTIFHWTKYPQDVYQHITAPHTSIYAIAGRKITDKLAVQVNTGIWTKQTYHNAVDKYGILGSRGFYYTTEPAGINVLLGGQITYEVNKIGVLAGYDNFSGGKFGLTYSF